MSVPFGRQPKKVTVRVEGEPQDVEFWLARFMRTAGYKGDDIQQHGAVVSLGPLGDHEARTFTIHPRAVND
jgi:hypothetical protein